MHFHARYRRAKLPRRIFVNTSDKLNGNHAAFIRNVGLGDSRPACINLTANTGNLAKDVVNGHQYKAKNKHEARHGNQPGNQGYMTTCFWWILIHGPVSSETPRW